MLLTLIHTNLFRTGLYRFYRPIVGAYEYILTREKGFKNNNRHTSAAEKICLTASEISGPIPSPGISVTF